MNSNLIIEREKEFIDEISDKYGYDSNIRHLLYIIIPAFIIKYGTSKEKLILDTFKNIKIISTTKKDDRVKAYYSSIPKKDNDKYITSKYMVIQNYKNIELIDLLDSLIHEFNHAVNSYINETNLTSKYLHLRTGITYRIYDKNTLEFIKKDSSYILEEIINTKQTEDIINIIKEFNPKNREITNTIYAVNSLTNHKYSSDSYYLQSYICKEIINNRTFISTLELLRINGEVYDIDKWFDNIMGKKNKYRELNELLIKVHDLEIKLVSKKFFRNSTIESIRSLSRDIMNIIEEFNSNVNFR